MSRPDWMEGFGSCNRIPGSVREEKTFISPRTTMLRHGLSRCEVVIVGRSYRWKVFHRKDGRLIAKLRGVKSEGYRYELVTPEGLKPSAWYDSKRLAEEALLLVL